MALSASLRRGQEVASLKEALEFQQVEVERALASRKATLDSMLDFIPNGAAGVSRVAISNSSLSSSSITEARTVAKSRGQNNIYQPHHGSELQGRLSSTLPTIKGLHHDADLRPSTITATSWATTRTTHEFQSPARSRPTLITGSKGLSPMFMREEDDPQAQAEAGGALKLHFDQNKSDESWRNERRTTKPFKAVPSPHGSALERLLFELEQDPERIGTGTLADAGSHALDGVRDELDKMPATMAATISLAPAKGKNAMGGQQENAAGGNTREMLPGIDSGRRKGGTSSWRPSPIKSKGAPAYFTGRKEPRRATIRERRKKEDALERKRKGPRWID